MNKKQKVVTILALLVFVFTVVVAPWAEQNLIFNYSPVWHPPTYGDGYTLQWSPLLATWLAVGVAYAGLFFVLKSKKTI